MLPGLREQLAIVEHPARRKMPDGTSEPLLKGLQKAVTLNRRIVALFSCKPGMPLNFINSMLQPEMREAIKELVEEETGSVGRVTMPPNKQKIREFHGEVADTAASDDDEETLDDD